jgi:PadR family transcriptional regulator, regulatory protein PadR
MPASLKRPRLSEPALRVLKVMLHNPTEPVYGLELMDRSGVSSGTLYPLLARLADAGWLAAEREAVDPAAVGRPARTYYRLTGEGLQEAKAALAVLAPPATLGWAVP